MRALTTFVAVRAVRCIKCPDYSERNPPVGFPLGPNPRSYRFRHRMSDGSLRSAPDYKSKIKLRFVSPVNLALRRNNLRLWQLHV